MTGLNNAYDPIPFLWHRGTLTDLAEERPARDEEIEAEPRGDDDLPLFSLSRRRRGDCESEPAQSHTPPGVL